MIIPFILEISRLCFRLFPIPYRNQGEVYSRSLLGMYAWDTNTEVFVTIEFLFGKINLSICEQQDPPERY